MEIIHESMDKDGNPPITFPYFLSLMALQMHDPDEGNLYTSSFAVYDDHNDGEIQVDQLEMILTNLND